MNIYVAAPWKHRERARVAAETLHQAGHLIIARWLAIESDTSDPQQLCEEAIEDWTDLSRCELMVLLNIEQSEGKAVEQGLALAWGIPIIGIGQPSNVFHYLPQYTWVPTLHAAIDYLQTAQIRVK